MFTYSSYLFSLLGLQSLSFEALVSVLPRNKSSRRTSSINLFQFHKIRGWPTKVFGMKCFCLFYLLASEVFTFISVYLIISTYLGGYDSI